MTMPAEKHAWDHDRGNNRKVSKPMMEKRRRARINESLEELKKLIFDSKQPQNGSNTQGNGRHKLEKADILEMAVVHVRNLVRQNSLNEESIGCFKAGYLECASEVLRFIDRIEGFDSTFRSRILKHMSMLVMQPHSGNESDASVSDRLTPEQNTSCSSMMDKSIIDEDISNCSSIASASSYEDCRQQNKLIHKPVNLTQNHSEKNSELSRFIARHNNKLSDLVAVDQQTLASEHVWRPW